MERNEKYLNNLVTELTRLPTEQEWVEFKGNNNDPEMIAKDISALSNAAALLERPYAFMVWGIEDKNHIIVGTKFDYSKTKKGNEDLEAWLARNDHSSKRRNYRKRYKKAIVQIPGDSNKGVACKHNGASITWSTGYKPYD